MEENQNKDQENFLENNGIMKPVETKKWPETLTVLDLSDKKLGNFDENLAFPLSLEELNLSGNKLSKIPSCLLSLERIKLLDLSYNNIAFFDDCPMFYNSIEVLDLSNNALAGPPYWVWTQAPAKLFKLNVSCNRHFTHSLSESYLAELLRFTTLLKEVLIYKCNIRKNSALELLGTFSKAISIAVGLDQLTNLDANVLNVIPCTGLDKCCDIERLDLSNTGIYNVEPGIDIYKNLVEINLSLNKITGLPDKFCNLENLEVCILSNNNIIYLPDNIVKLKKLVCLRLDSNGLYMIPEHLCSLPNLRVLDLYDNSLYEVPNEIVCIDELDLAQNFLEEPDDAEYLGKKHKLRCDMTNRVDGRKTESSPIPSEYSSSATDDEELIEYLNRVNLSEAIPEAIPPSPSPEDWDDDEYWIPGFIGKTTIHPRESPWLTFAKRMMEAGNFCPMDVHQASVADTVRYDRYVNPRAPRVADGQFDDYPGDQGRELRLN